jgi:hypothetical protein
MVWTGVDSMTVNDLKLYDAAASPNLHRVRIEEAHIQKVMQCQNTSKRSPRA